MPQIPRAKIDTYSNEETAAAPFICRNADMISGPIILSAPHSGTDYSEYLLCGDDIVAMRTLEDSGTAEIAMTAAAHLRPAIIATCPRAFIDLNRPADALDPHLFPGALPPENQRWQRHIQAGYGIIPRLSADRRPLYKDPPAPSILTNRIKTIHRAYHQILESWVQDMSNYHDHPLLVDIHSMPQAKPDQKPLPDFVFGDLHGVTLPQDLKVHINHFMKSHPYSWGWNHPFAGGYITQHYGTGDTAIATLQIEVNRGLFLQHAETDSAALSALADCVKSLIDSLSDVLSARHHI